MTTELDALRARTEDLVQFGVETSQGLGSRISTWLVVGNVGGLVLTFNAIVQGTSCDLSSLRRAAIGFAVGAGLGILSVVVSYVNALLNTFSAARLLQDMRTGQKNRGREGANWLLAALGFLLLAASFTALAATVLLPLIGDGAALQACAMKGKMTH